MNILIVGASVAGPVAAHWLSAFGFNVSMIDRHRQIAAGGGHAVDLYAGALDICRRMGIEDDLRAKSMDAQTMKIRLPGGRQLTADAQGLFASMSDRHLEIMRDDLSSRLRSRIEEKCRWGIGLVSARQDSDGVTCTLRETATGREFDERYDVVIGADGLHSATRRATMARAPEVFLGRHFAIASVPRDRAVEGQYDATVGAGRLVNLYTAGHLADARAGFYFTGPARALPSDPEQCRSYLRGRFANFGAHVTQLLDDLVPEAPFYFDSITQLRSEQFTQGRVALAGDAGYCPGPVVGASSSLAVVGGYVLACELARANGDHGAAFAAYERVMHPIVADNRRAAATGARTLVPASTWGAFGLGIGATALSRAPKRLARMLTQASPTAKFFGSVAPPEYPDLRPPTQLA